jgi:hypothetical protein
LTSSGTSQITVAGVQPCAIAAAYTIGFRADPGWRGASATLTCPSISALL